MSDYIQGEDDGCGGEFELEREFLFIVYALRRLRDDTEMLFCCEDATCFRDRREKSKLKLTVKFREPG